MTLRPPYSDTKLAENIFNSIVSFENINDAYAVVRQLSETIGFEGTTRFEESLETNFLALQREMDTLSYRPRPMYHLDTIKPEKEWVMEFAVLLILREFFESSFLGSSHGSSHGKGLSTAAEQIEDITRHGYHWIVNVDSIAWISSYIEAEALTETLFHYITDDKLRSLLSSMIQVEEVMRNDLMVPATFSGSPLITLLYNIYFHSLDEFISQKGVQYVRCNHLALMFFKTRGDAERAYHEVHTYMTGIMGLKSKYHENQVLVKELHEATDYLQPFFEMPKD